MEAEPSLPPPAANQNDMFAQKQDSPGKTTQEDLLLNELMNLDPDELSPKAALEALYKLKSILQKID